MVRRRTLSPWVAAVVLATIALVGTLVATSGHPGAPASPSPPNALGASPRPTGTARPTTSTEPRPSAAATGHPSPRPSARPTARRSPRPTPSPVARRHVWWIILENHEYGAIIGNAQAPYLNGLADRYGLATNAYATSHPSEPNYIALVAGSTRGVTSDGTYNLAGPNLFSQLAAAGRTWRVYAQDDQAGCYAGSVAGGGLDGPGAAGTYARKHNPAISFTSVSGNPAQCRNIEPLAAFDPGAGLFELVIPNLVNDMHDGSVGQGDAFLRAFVPTITGSAAFRTGGVLFITFDEGSTSAGSQGDHGGHIATIVIAADLAPGSRDTGYADHWSLLRTTEDLLGLPCLGGACNRSPFGY